MFCFGCIISAAYEFRVRGITQGTIVERYLNSLAESYEYIDDPVASNIARGYKNPADCYVEAAGKVTSDQYNEIVEHFQSQIIGLIKENEKKHLRDSLILMIQEDEEIENDTIVEIITGIKKCDLAEKTENLAAFLAGIFLYAMRNTKNNIGGKAKKVTEEYITRVKNGEKPKIKIVKKKKEKSEHVRSEQKAETRSRELELMEERVEQEAVSFCRKYEAEKEYIALCQIASITNPTRNHFREMYNDFCECTLSVRRKILELSSVKVIGASGNGWWHRYLTMFEEDYEKIGLGDNSHTYAFTQYFPRLLEYGDKSIKTFTQRVFPPKVVTPVMKKIPEGFKLNIVGLIDEYIYYKKIAKYRKKLEPPMDYLWRELHFSDCPDFMITAVLAFFIIGTCYKVPLLEISENNRFEFSGPGAEGVETAEDLFYQTLLTLYENYELAK